MEKNGTLGPSFGRMKPYFYGEILENWGHELLLGLGALFTGVFGTLGPYSHREILEPRDYKFTAMGEPSP